jgi:hypothetical protein
MGTGTFLRWITLGAVVLASFLILSPPAPVDADSAGAVTMRPGWDNTAQSLNYSSSWVRAAQVQGSGNLKVQVHLEGAAPQSRHEVDLDVFSASVCARFGDLKSFDTCRTISRQGITATVTPFRLGAVTIGESGVGELQRVVTGVVPGSYDVEFAVAVSDCQFCNIVYQAPGPTFAGTTRVTVKEENGAAGAATSPLGAKNYGPSGPFGSSYLENGGLFASCPGDDPSSSCSRIALVKTHYTRFG